MRELESEMCPNFPWNREGKVSTLECDQMALGKYVSKSLWSNSLCLTSKVSLTFNHPLIYAIFSDNLDHAEIGKYSWNLIPQHIFNYIKKLTPKIINDVLSLFSFLYSLLFNCINKKKKTSPICILIFIFLNYYNLNL